MKPGVLVGKPIVVLAPYVRGEQVIERCHGPAPGDAVSGLQPFGVLVEHRVDDVDKRLIAGEKAMAAGQQVGLQPTLALVLREHLHDPPFGCQVVVAVQALGLPLAVGDLEDSLQAGWKRLRPARTAGTWWG